MGTPPIAQKRSVGRMKPSAFRIFSLKNLPRVGGHFFNCRSYRVFHGNGTRSRVAHFASNCPQANSYIPDNKNRHLAGYFYPNLEKSQKASRLASPMLTKISTLKPKSKVAPKRVQLGVGFRASCNPYYRPLTTTAPPSNTPTFCNVMLTTLHKISGKTSRVMKTKPSLQRVSIDGMRPLALTKKQIIAVLGSAKLVDRMLWATRHAGGRWLTIIREGRDLLVATESVEAAYVRLVGGELPPLMPSERKGSESEATA